MLRFGLRPFLLGGGAGDSPEVLDRPLSNFDVIGIPTGAWSSHFCACANNVVPSCLLSFFCPCVMWAQIVVRAQIPLIIGIKNSFACLREGSGYHFFMDWMLWPTVLGVGLILVLAFASLPSSFLFWLLILLIVASLGTVFWSLGHTRTAFKEKYRLPSSLPDGCLVWDMVLDVLITTLCFPCALSQMARHVFQYDRMDTNIGCFVGDPSSLPPLRPLDVEQARGNFERPERADEAGLSWVRPGPHPSTVRGTGAAIQQEEIMARQVEELKNDRTPAPSAPVMAQPVAGGIPGGKVYRQDGSAV